MHQLTLFDQYLHQRGKSVASLLQHYYTRHFRTDYGYDPGHELSLPQADDSYANKIKVLAPELESVVKRYDLFVEAGEVDPFLYEYKTGFRIDDAHSLLKEQQKYAVIAPENNEIYKLMYLLFSDQAGVNHVAPYLDNQAKMDVLKQLWDRQEISYHHCTPPMQAEIMRMMDSGWLEFDDHLLSPSERHWVNFYLNDAEYSNGLKIRNRYAHGQGNLRPEEDRAAYYALLLVFIVLLLKMDDDLALHQDLKK
ncbi:hypothetical protein EVA_16553 [gut metagenome]|uniref:Uncharacterized protein n=1 Tax=gut metagenome TaxID=749906 RepID=J9G767_9ZZZZ